MLTATQLIYQAALASKAVTVPSGKQVNYSPAQSQPVKDTICWLCGGETDGQGVPVKKTIKPTFTDHPYARGQGSGSICEACAFCLSHREMRNYSIVATEKKLLHPSRAELKEILLSPPAPPFVVCIAVSGQKWVHFKSEVNYDKQQFFVNFEEQRLSVIPEELKFYLEIIEALYLGFTKDEIKTGNYGSHRIRQFGIEKWHALEQQAEKVRRTPLFGLALFIAQKKEEEKGCFSASGQTIIPRQQQLL